MASGEDGLASLLDEALEMVDSASLASNAGHLSAENIANLAAELEQKTRESNNTDEDKTGEEKSTHDEENGEITQQQQQPSERKLSVEEQLEEQHEERQVGAAVNGTRTVAPTSNPLATLAAEAVKAGPAPTDGDDPNLIHVSISSIQS
jgi:hypothetical protein